MLKEKVNTQKEKGAGDPKISMTLNATKLLEKFQNTRYHVVNKSPYKGEQSWQGFVEFCKNERLTKLELKQLPAALNAGMGLSLDEIKSMTLGEIFDFELE